MYIYTSVIILIFVLNYLGFFLAYFFQTDKLTDITYSLSFICVALMLLNFFSSFNLIQVLTTAMICLWAARLGMFLFRRIHQMGVDKRFNEMRKSFLRFGGFWTLQSVSVLILVLPVIQVFDNSPSKFTLTHLLGLVIFIAGLGIESLADFQKSNFKKDSPSSLYKGGLYSIVQYPNYLGEILVWSGIWIYGIPSYEGWTWISIISPLWTFVLLRYISGIPYLIEGRDKKYADSQTYKIYKNNTPLLLPRIF